MSHWSMVVTNAQVSVFERTVFFFRKMADFGQSSQVRNVFNVYFIAVR